MMLAYVLATLGLSGSLSAWVLVRRHVDVRSARYYATLALENVAFVLQGSAVLALLGRVSPVLAALAAGLCFAWLSADALAYGYAGLRMQFNLLAAVGELPTLGARLPWRRALTALFLGAVLFGGLFYEVTSKAESTAWLTIGIGGAVGVIASLIAVPLRRGLPIAATFDWSIRAIAMQVAILDRWFGAQKKSVRVENPWNVPSTLVPRNETATSIDPTRPLMRQSAGFNGTTHFDVRINPGEKPHVVIIFMESVRAADVGVLGAKFPSITPCFDALAQQGVLWRDFYAGGTNTALAMNSALYGVPPPFIQRTYTESSTEATMLGMPHIFADEGYLPAFFCDGPLDWENKRQFALHNGFRLFYGAPSIKSRFPEAPEVVWHFPDEFLMRFHAEWLAKQDAQGKATFSSLLTVTNHYPWAPPKNAPVIDVPIEQESLQHRYLRCTAYTDRCLGQYMEEMKERGLDKKTIFLIMGDHAQQVNDVNDVWWAGRPTTDGMRVPCLLYAPGRVSPKVIDEVAGQADLLPTLLDIFGFHAKHHAIGTSMRRQCGKRFALTVQPWIPGMLATRFGSFRHAYSFESRRSALYHADNDPDSFHDISDTHSDVAAQRQSESEKMRAFFDLLYRNDSIATAPGTAYLRGRLLLNAPDHFPATIEACRERLHSLQTMRTQRTRSDAIETTVLMLALGTQGLEDSERLDFSQLLLARVHIAAVGELTDEEDTRLARLNEKATYPAAMPDWERNMIESVRHLANEKPYPFYRTAKPGKF